MTRNLHHDYLDLISSCKAYIAQEYPTSSSLVADADNFNYFKMQAQQGRTPAPPKAITPTPAPPSAIPQGAIKALQSSPVATAPAIPVIEPEIAQPIPATETSKEPTTQKGEKVKLSPHLKREVLEPTKTNDFSDLSKLWQDNYSHIPYLAVIPSDEQAKIISRRWQNPPSVPNIVLLYFNENPHEIAFLNNIAAAITQYFGSAGLIAAPKVESERGWNKLLSASSLKLVITHHHSLFTLPELTQQYREDPVRGNHTLGRAPLLLLSDLSLYMQQPKLKIALWQALCQRFAVKR
jgi:hypothetical protein